VVTRDPRIPKEKLEWNNIIKIKEEKVYNIQIYTYKTVIDMEHAKRVESMRFVDGFDRTSVHISGGRVTWRYWV
jgi:hypothetical protein